MKYIAPVVVCFCFFALGCKTAGDCCGSCSNEVQAQEDAKQDWNAKPLFADGLADWQRINNGGQGPIEFTDGVLDINMDIDINALKYIGDPKALFGPSLENYAITLQAQRVEGTDIFLGLTFPVGDKGAVSLVLGGWGGALTGLSNLDGLNASENTTTEFIGFKDKQWYDVKVYVTAEKIACWVDGEQIVDVVRADVETFDTHSAVIETKPFGLFTFATWGALKDVKVWTP